MKIPEIDIMMVAPEIGGMRKVGGLGDFVISYARALAHHYGSSPTVVVPTPKDFPISNPITTLTIDKSKIPVYSLGLNGINVLALGSPKDEEGCINISVYPLQTGKYELKNYGSYRIAKEEAQTSALFASSVVEMIKRGIVKPDVVDVHDWVSAALVTMLLRNPDENLRRLAVAYASHNELYRGTMCPDHSSRINSWSEFVGAFGLKPFVTYNDSPDFLTPQFDQRDPNVPLPAFSIGQGAMNLADAVRIVGEHYAQESGQAYGREIQGIKNGLDKNAKSDLLGVSPDSDMDTKIQAKAQAKRTIQEKLMLNVDPKVNLLVYSHRYADEKNPEALEYLVLNMGGLNIQVVARKVPSTKKYDPKRVNIENVFESDEFTTLAFRAADGVLSCSTIEPWGYSIAQGMAALAVPIVSPAAGNRDLVTPYNGVDGTGFMARTFSRDDLVNAVIKFVNTTKNPAHLQRLRENLNRIDLTWEGGPLIKHLRVYEQAKQARDKRTAK